MGTVIEFPRVNKQNMTVNDILTDARMNPPDSRYAYLTLCKKVLLVEDYASILCAIMDSEFYDELEPDLQRIVNSYFEFER